MLGKLLKHDLRSTARLILPATLLMLGICILGSVALRIAISNAEAMVSKGNVATLLIFLAFIMMYMISMLALVVYSSASIFLVIIHYYKNLFTDEGYLTFTLPVSTSSILTSKLLASSIWMVVATSVVLVCMAISMFLGIPGEAIDEIEGWGVFFREFAISFSDAFGVGSVDLILLILETVILLVVSVLSGILQAFLAITIGAIVAKKHKIIAAVGFYFLITTVVSAVVSTIMMVFQFGSLFSVELLTMNLETGESLMDPMIYSHGMMIVNILIYLGLTIAEYAVTLNLLKKRLNVQ